MRFTHLLKQIHFSDKMAALSMRGLILKPAPALVSLAPSCNFASEVRPREINTAAMKRGRGGRSSFSGDVVTVFGSNGFIGTAIANRYRREIFPGEYE